MRLDRAKAAKGNEQKPRARVERADLQVGALIRILALAMLAVIGSVWALVRFYTRARPAMVVPAGEIDGSTERDGGVRWIEAPEVERGRQ
jgi:hypothetical protein